MKKNVNSSDDVLRQLKALMQRMDEREKKLKQRRAALEKPKSSIDFEQSDEKIRKLFGGYPIPDEDDDEFAFDGNFYNEPDDDDDAPLWGIYGHLPDSEGYY